MIVAALLILFSLFAGRQVYAQVQAPTYLRPFPNQFTQEEAAKELNPDSPDPSLTIYCAQRPTAVQNNPIDKRQPTMTLRVQGNLSADFSRFVTPLLSITDTSKPDASLSDVDKSRQYLADYLEGRAYYEGVAENPNNLSLARLGVFRKLAPQTYQDQLKIAMIKRATGDGIIIAPPPTTSCEAFDSVVNSWTVKDSTCKLCNADKIKAFVDVPASVPNGLPPLLIKLIEAAADVYRVPAGVILGTMYHEGAFSRDVAWTDENVRKWSCQEPMPLCNDSLSVGYGQWPFGWIPKWFYAGEGDDAYWNGVTAVDPSKNSKDKVSPCNLMDGLFATAKVLHLQTTFLSGDAYEQGINQCYGYSLNNRSAPATCGGWTDNIIAQSQVNYGGYCSAPGQHSIQPYYPDNAPFIQQTLTYHNNFSCGGIAAVPQEEISIAQLNPANDNPYGFQPASATVHNYSVTDGATSVLLRDFIGHEKPLPEGYDTDAQYQIALDAWNLEDGGKWARLWPYVPMFSREDVKGFVQAVDEPFQNTNPNPIEVAIPHLARTYEVASALSYILSPYDANRSYSEPNLSSQWTNPGPWAGDKFWLDSDESQPGNWDDLGAVCDPQQTVITSSGDLAYDERSNTTTFKQVEMDNPFYNPNNPDACVKEINGVVDDSDCFVDQAVRYSPTYLKTYTPFLHAIMDRLLTGPYAVFSVFKPYSQIAKEDLENWPAAGNPQEENLAYSFSGGQAEAGLQQPGQPASYYFKYLGTIHCEKEKLMAGLQPFLGGSAYEIDPQCTPGEPGGPPPGGGGPPPGACSSEKEALPFGNSAASPIAKRAWGIVSDLYQGFWCYWNRSPGDYSTDVTLYPPSYPELFDEVLFAQNPNLEGDARNTANLFWCTWLVIKSFQESGNKIGGYTYTPSMATDFESRGKYLPVAAATYRNVSPGYAVFFKIPPGNYRLNHVAIVYNVSVDGITTVESNAGYKTMFYPTDASGHFQIVNGIEIAGFGRP